MDSENTSTEIIFVRYDDRNLAVTTENEICKFHITLCNQNYENSREI